jgi:hypothetical protein
MQPRRHGPRPATSWRAATCRSECSAVGTVEATDEAAAIEKAAAEFKVSATRLLAMTRRKGQT